MESSDENESDKNSVGEAASVDELFGCEDEVEPEEEEAGSAEKTDNVKEKDGKNKNEKDKEDEKPVKKRIIRNPPIVLNFERLTSANGIPALNEMFENFKFRGHNHEKEDLTCIIQKLQHWMCHHLYPGYDFETTLKLLEKLGRKRPVQTYMRKLREEYAAKKIKVSEDAVDNGPPENDVNENSRFSISGK